jgi:hypothetical protein
LATTGKRFRTLCLLETYRIGSAVLKLEDLKVGAQVQGIQPGGIVTIVQIAPVGEDALAVHNKRTTKIGWPNRYKRAFA